MSTNLPTTHVPTLITYIREAWETSADLTVRLATLCNSANTIQINMMALGWNAVANEYALYYTASYYAKFKVRDRYGFQIVTMFTHTP